MSTPLVERVQASRQALQERPQSQCWGVKGWQESRKQPISHCQEKPLTRPEVPVPQTDTGRWGEKPKAREKTLVKELGKMNP